MILVILRYWNDPIIACCSHLRQSAGRGDRIIYLLRAIQAQQPTTFHFKGEVLLVTHIILLGSFSYS